MNVEDELQQLARDRESATQAVLRGMRFEPDHLRRQLRQYLSRQVEHGRMKRLDDRVPQLTRARDDLYKLACPDVEFSNGGRLLFNIQLEENQRAWILGGFEFHLHLPHSRKIRIELNSEVSHDPLRVPRCHFHLDDWPTHIPFPIMHPRLVLSLICEHIEPDLGVPEDHKGAGRKTRHTP